MNNKYVEQVSNLAKRTAREILLPNFSRVTVKAKEDNSWLTIADTKAHELLIAELPKILTFPVLSEEMTHEEQQKILDNNIASYWCIDPLDGTSNFSQGIPYWCISIALVIDSKVALGVVYDPNRDECFAATDATSTTLNDKPLDLDASPVSTNLKSAMALIDFKRLNLKQKTLLVSTPPYHSQRSMGASALDLCWIAAQRCQIYLHGHQKIWDHAAGLLILEKAKGHAKTFNGKDVFDNDLCSKTVIAACDQNYFKAWNSCFQAMI